MFSLFLLLLFFCCCCYIHIISDTIVHISVDKCIESNAHCHQKCWKPCKCKCKNKQRHKKENVFFVHHNCEVPLASMNPGTEIHRAVEVRYILTPSKSIKIFLVCSDIEYFDNFQVQHYSFHHHPSKGNEVKIVDCDGNSYTQKLRQEQQKNNG